MSREKSILSEAKKKVKDLQTIAKVEEKKQKKEAKIVQKEATKLAKRKARIERNTINSWLTLDNAATIYPSIREEKWDFVYRISTVLLDKVDKEILQRAVDDITPRFPSFFVKLKSGFFWNYFEIQDKRLLVEDETMFPCSRFRNNSKGHMIRVLVYNHRISVECFHAIADGRSTLKFLNSLLKRYFVLKGCEIGCSEGCLEYLDKPKREELVDSFFEHSNSEKGLKHKEKSAYFIKGTNEENGVINSTIGIMSVSELKEIAQRHNAKLFEFIVAVLGYVIQKRAKSCKNPVKISVPIDLRSFFESESLRNFSGYLNVELPVKEYSSIDEVIDIVKSEMAKITKDRMQGFINSNVSMQKNFFIKIVPLFIKNFVIKECFRVWGESYQTLALSNLGAVKVPDEFGEYIDYYEFNVGRPKYNAKSAGIITFGDKLVFTMSSKIKENTTEKDFFTYLSKLGANITINTNRRDIYE